MRLWENTSHHGDCHKTMTTALNKEDVHNTFPFLEHVFTRVYVLQISHCLHSSYDESSLRCLIDANYRIWLHADTKSITFVGIKTRLTHISGGRVTRR